MTREDEILSAASDHRDWVCCGFIDFVADARRDSFAEGAKWADKTMIDKACKILENVTVVYNKRFFGKCEENAFDADFIKEFRKAMEE